jgi:hypothetical protein
MTIGRNLQDAAHSTEVLRDVAGFENKFTSVQRKGKIVSRAARGSRFEWISAARHAAEIHSSNSR